jgi:hypothetical protein
MDDFTQEIRDTKEDSEVQSMSTALMVLEEIITQHVVINNSKLWEWIIDRSDGIVESDVTT